MMHSKTIALLLLTVFCSIRNYAQDGAKRIEAESYDNIHNAATKKGDGGIVVNKFSKGAWVTYNDVDFGKEGATEIKFRVGCGTSTILEVRLGDAKGKVIGKLKVKTERWKLGEQTLKIKKLTGKQTITLVAPGTGVVLNWFEIL